MKAPLKSVVHSVECFLQRWLEIKKKCIRTVLPQTRTNVNEVKICALQNLKIYVRAALIYRKEII